MPLIFFINLTGQHQYGQPVYRIDSGGYFSRAEEIPIPPCNGFSTASVLQSKMAGCAELTADVWSLIFDNLEPGSVCTCLFVNKFFRSLAESKIHAEYVLDLGESHDFKVNVYIHGERLLDFLRYHELSFTVFDTRRLFKSITINATNAYQLRGPVLQSISSICQDGDIESFELNLARSIEADGSWHDDVLELCNMLNLTLLNKGAKIAINADVGGSTEGLQPVFAVIDNIKRLVIPYDLRVKLVADHDYPIIDENLMGIAGSLVDIQSEIISTNWRSVQSFLFACVKAETLFLEFIVEEPCQQAIVFPDSMVSLTTYDEIEATFKAKGCTELHCCTSQLETITFDFPALRCLKIQAIETSKGTNPDVAKVVRQVSRMSLETLTFECETLDVILEYSALFKHVSDKVEITSNAVFNLQEESEAETQILKLGKIPLSCKTVALGLLGMGRNYTITTLKKMVEALFKANEGLEAVDLAPLQIHSNEIVRRGECLGNSTWYVNSDSDSESEW